MAILVSILLSALGGIVAGLGAARLIRGNMTGGLLGGMAGAMAVHFYLYPVSESGLPGDWAALLQGAAGGAALGLAGGFMMKKKA
ncbi:MULTISPECIES: hypothetical protein [Hyphomonas]|uniref:Uncharacterized protein n=2 Tax=Hyphomonas adhaerens TaxID=81029 RepID=A0A069E2J5_9PROT|nr:MULTISPECIES: hypothetical protein [Hyphomonas]KCZ84300.1 hypothetical protein HAD_01435 [Hyphomonas adhaerens MHS-3]MBB39028.1 hypothetical protein [Hyphomonas sp.]HAE28484.1 hypothetical protein [Hyphomonas adhaerens]|tara:strand:+ start:733 stop:987 length:255 start_codon:yes stop_codon:yes gene_type:complete